MTVPTWPRFVEPVLRELALSHSAVSRTDIRTRAIALLQLPAAELAERLPSGRFSKAEHRAEWALSYASMAGLVESPRRGQWQLSDAGRALLAKYPSAIPDAELERIAKVRKAGADDGEVTPASPVPERVVTSEAPDIRMAQAYDELRASTRAEILSLVRAVSPQKFEVIVLDVLHAMGYGKSRSQLHTTAAGADGGIDGVISLDRLGLEKVYVQAKRYAADNPVSRPMIQSFIGALAERRATRGVYITTSRFSKDARECAARSSDSLVLVGGDEFAELMLEYRVGVTARETFTVLGVDGDYFEDG